MTACKRELRRCESSTSWAVVSKRWFDVAFETLWFDFTGPGFDDISAHIVKSSLKGFLGRTRLVDPCFVHLVIARAILNFDSRLDRNITICDLTGKMSSYLSF